VLVVGGGPAGLKAAEVAGRRGHRVVLAERDTALGGRLKLAALGPKAELLKSVRWLADELDLLEVDVRLGTEAGAGLLDELRPDAVVLAAGATTDVAGFAAGIGDGSVPVISIDDALTAAVTGQRVVVLDHLGSADVYTAAERAAVAGARVTLVTPQQTMAANVGFTHLKELLERLYAAGVEPVTSTALTAIDRGELVIRHVHAKRVGRLPADLLVAGVPAQPDLSLAAELDRRGLPTLVVGDANAPRTALHAFREGSDAGAAV
jgi:NADPH-dependent 2,4-dienoyl-CoA reductase/sulfur reductase-like enzyme